MQTRNEKKRVVKNFTRSHYLQTSTVYIYIYFSPVSSKNSFTFSRPSTKKKKKHLAIIQSEKKKKNKIGKKGKYTCRFQSCGGGVAGGGRRREHEDVRGNRDARGGALRQDGSGAGTPGQRGRPGHPGLATEHGARSSGTVPAARHSGHHRRDKKCVSDLVSLSLSFSPHARPEQTSCAINETYIWWRKTTCLSASCHKCITEPIAPIPANVPSKNLSERFA